MVVDKTILMEIEGAEDEFLGPIPTVSPNKFHLTLWSESLVLPLRQKIKEGMER